MADALLLAAAALWLAAAILALAGVLTLSRVALAAGAVAGVAAAVAGLPDASGTVTLPGRLAAEAVQFRIAPQGLWLMGFGLVPAAFACSLASPATGGRRGWLFGAALSLLGALGVFGLENGAALLIAWEAMSLGGAIMILSDDLGPAGGRTVLFMLALLEAGAVALVLAVALLGLHAGSLDFNQFQAAAPMLTPSMQIGLGVLLMLGFGAKLGLLPFYEWFPGAYGSASGASGAIMSGVVMNAAYFALARALVNWLPVSPQGAFPALAILVIAVATVSAILTILYAFQQDDWRTLLSFSSAENTSIAVAALGAAMLFRNERLNDLAGLAWTVALLHLAGHALAKGGLFLAADGLSARQAGITSPTPAPDGTGSSGWRAAGGDKSGGDAADRRLRQRMVHVPDRLPGVPHSLPRRPAGARPDRRGPRPHGGGGVCDLRQGGGLGRSFQKPRPAGRHRATLRRLGGRPGPHGAGPRSGNAAVAQSARRGHDGAVRDADRLPDARRPAALALTAKFAFISPSLLVIVMPLLSLIPIALAVAASRRPVRRTAVWYGGLSPDRARASTTTLTFSNAMRTFYSFVYRPTAATERDADAGGYFVTRLSFEHDVAPISGLCCSSRPSRIVQGWLRGLASCNRGSSTSISV